ncbi:MAG: hypothetical protein IPK85_07260 [Gemmatimonadetes bacterium]|nr:hypothetical protein [Gemmatimonadota bacterium]
MRSLLVLIALASLAACREPTQPPKDPERPARAVQGSMGPSITPCQWRWRQPVSGNWTDTTKWSPSGVPSSGQVCIDRPGTYIVNVDGGVHTLSDLDLGPSTQLTLAVANHSGLRVGGRTEVPSGGALHLVAQVPQPLGTVFEFDHLVNRDSLTIAERVHAGFVENHGTMVMQQLVRSAKLVFDSLETDGTVRLVGLAEWISANRAVLAGDIAKTDPSAHLHVRPQGGRHPVVEWRGAALPSRVPADTGRAAVLVSESDLHLNSILNDGAIDVASGARIVRVTGDVEYGTSLRTWADPGGRVELAEEPGNARGIRVSGALLLGDTLGTTAPLPLRVIGSLRAYGSITVTDSVVYSGALLSNYDTLNVTSGHLDLRTGTYVGSSASAQLGPMTIRAGARLEGEGTVGDVQVVGGTVAPGGVLQKVLQVGSLALDSQSTVSLSYSAASDFDQLVVAGALSAAGSLVPATDNGRCGEVFPAIVRPAALSSGAFTPGGSQYPGVGWRAWPAGDTILAVGHDPSALVSARSSGALIEGAAPIAGHVCLGGTGPTAPVHASFASVFGEFTMSPSQVTFNVATWGLPVPVTVSAVDDARADGQVLDSLSQTLTSADPAYQGYTRSVPAYVNDNDPPVDLALTLVSAPSVVNLNQVAEARYRITNNGPGASTGSSLSIPSLVGVTYQSAGAGVTCTTSAGTLTCTAGALASGASLEFVIVFRASTSGSWTNTAQVSGSDYDHVSTNNSAAWMFTVP